MPRPANDPRPRGAAPGPTAPAQFPHGALFAAVRSGDAVAARALLDHAEASGASLATLAGEAATHAAADARREEVVRLILSLNEFMAASITTRVDLVGVQSHIDIGTAPCFDGTDYATWKWMMEIHLSAMHPTIWRIVERGYTVKDTDSPTTKEQNEHKNALAVNAILSGLSRNERNKVYGLKTAKEIWDELQLAHQGTPCHREFKIELLTEELGRLVMEEGEAPNEMYNRLIRIVNEIKGLGSKEMTDSYVVKKMLRAITPRNPTLATIIRKQEDFAKLTPHCLLGRVHDLIDQRSSSRKKYLAPKARKEAKDSSSEEDSEDHELIKRLRKSIKRQFKRPCYECGEAGHFMTDCPNKKDKGNDEKRKVNHSKKNKSKSLKKSQKGQSLFGKESNDSSTDSDDENVHMCL